MKNTALQIGRQIKKHVRIAKRFFRFGKKPYPILVKTPETTFTIIIDPYHNGCVDETIADTKLWEPALTTRLSSYITPTTVFFDIGANIGYHSMFVASLNKPAGQVHSFEPIESLNKQIKQSVAVNNYEHVTVHHCGLGKKTETKTIFKRDENMGGSSLAKYDELTLVRVSGTEAIQIQTLDSLFPNTTKVDVIKIDVEGYEFEVLEGGKNLCTTQKPVIFLEFSPIFYERDYTDKSIDFIDFLQKIGYRFTTLDGADIDLLTWFRTTPHTQIDIVCVPINSLN